MLGNSFAILTSRTSWFLPYAIKLSEIIKEEVAKAEVFTDYNDIPDQFEIVFILSYFKLIPVAYLKKRKHNLVVHESALPQGKGWAPLFWQILEGKNSIPIVLFEAGEEVDSGPVFFQSTIELNGTELNEEIREKQANATIDLCLNFVKAYPNVERSEQSGESTFYPKRTAEDSRLDLDKTLGEQFNLLRIVNNNDYPAYFHFNGEKYIVKIFKDKK
jgi:methionyl-tRNA formyltransferase